MERISTTEYERVLPVLDQTPISGCQANWIAILERRQPGAVYVDDVSHPCVALIRRGTGPLYLFGDPSTQVVSDFLPELVRNDLPTKWPVLYAPEEWHSALEHLLPSPPSYRLIFKWNGMVPSAPDAGESVSPDGQLCVMNAQFIASNMQEIIPWIEGLWGSLEAFETAGVGFALMVDGQVACSCQSAAIGGGGAEIRIETTPSYRRRGFAYHTAKAFIAACLQRGLSPGWSCESSNTASAKLAARLGFEPVARIAGYAL